MKYLIIACMLLTSGILYSMEKVRAMPEAAPQVTPEEKVNRIFEAFEAGILTPELVESYDLRFWDASKLETVLRRKANRVFERAEQFIRTGQATESEQRNILLGLAVANKFGMTDVAKEVIRLRVAIRPLLSIEEEISVAIKQPEPQVVREQEKLSPLEEKASRIFEAFDAGTLTNAGVNSFAATLQEQYEMATWFSKKASNVLQRAEQFRGTGQATDNEQRNIMAGLGFVNKFGSPAMKRESVKLLVAIRPKLTIKEEVPVVEIKQPAPVREVPQEKLSPIQEKANKIFEMFNAGTSIKELVENFKPTSSEKESLELVIGKNAPKIFAQARQIIGIKQATEEEAKNMITILGFIKDFSGSGSEIRQATQLRQEIATAFGIRY